MTDDMMRRSLGPELFSAASMAVLSRQLPAEVTAARLTLAEMVVIHVWTLDTSPEPWFARIDAMMRMADLPRGEFEAVMPVTRALSSGLRKLPPYVGTVYRGVKERPMGADAFEQFVRNHETLPEVYHPGFVGAAQIESGSLRGRAKLAIQSKTWRDISSLSSMPEQHEVLFMPPLKLAPILVVPQKGWGRIWASEI